MLSNSSKIEALQLLQKKYTAFNAVLILIAFFLGDKFGSESRNQMLENLFKIVIPILAFLLFIFINKVYLKNKNSIADKLVLFESAFKLRLNILSAFSVICFVVFYFTSGYIFLAYMLGLTAFIGKGKPTQKLVDKL